MTVSTLSIRHQLLLLGALATASIWAGALLQYLQLRGQSNDLVQVREELASAGRYARIARDAAQERGLSHGWLSQAVVASTAELTPARQQLDADLALIAGPPPAGVVAPLTLPAAVGSRTEQLPRIRGRIDRRELSPQEAFGFYTSLVAAVQDTAARRLAGGMIAVGLPYEHVNHLQRAAELLAQMRGLVNGLLRAGPLQFQGESALLRLLGSYDDTRRLIERSVPDGVQPTIAMALDAAAVRDSLERVRRLLQTRQLDALALDPTAWWSLATEAVDTLQQAAGRESVSLSQQADGRIAAIERRLRLTVIALVVLGIVTLALVLSTVGRIVRGLDRLIEGLDAVGKRRNFAARIDESARDEFGAISGSINKLIAIAGSVVQEQEVLSLTDPLTGAMNRRGFDQQLSARTLVARAHSPPLSLVMIDVDHFKAVNDSFGHASGDLVLKGLGQVLRAALRPDDVLARFGGEEFVAVLPGCAVADALRVAEKLRASVSSHDFGIDRQVTVSLGVAQWTRGQAPAALISVADAQLYAAKAAGRNRVMPLLQWAQSPVPSVLHGLV